MKMKKILALVLTGAMTLSMAGLTANAAAPDKDLVIAIEGTVSSMEPAEHFMIPMRSATRRCLRRTASL